MSSSDADSAPYRFDTIQERDGTVVSRSPWGSDDEIGRLNWITPETTGALIAEADGTRIFDLWSSTSSACPRGRLPGTRRFRSG